ncbi:MAG: hypothetical protein JW833_11580 [Prolixibacteraceae bacterium]|nr:hypothetical protein [Prolixibacteraceae bacterium]
MVFTFTEPGSNVNRNINMDQILSISKKTGDHMVLYGLAMGASGCLGAVLGASLAESDANSMGMTVDQDSKKNTILILTGISTLAGAIWGAATPKYSKVYENPQYAERFIDRFNVGISIGKETQLCLRYNF